MWAGAAAGEEKSKNKTTRTMKKKQRQKKEQVSLQRIGVRDTCWGEGKRLGCV